MQNQPSSRLLRNTLFANAAFSAFSGIVLTGGARWISSLLGITSWWIVLLVGISLILFALGLFRNARRHEVNLNEASQAVAMDFAWVSGSFLLIYLGVFSGTGNWMVAVVADIVLVFGVLQAVGIRRLRRSAAVA